MQASSSLELTEVPESCLSSSGETVGALKSEKKSTLGITSNNIIIIINNNDIAEIRNAPGQKAGTDFLTKAAGQTFIFVRTSAEVNNLDVENNCK